MLEAGSTLAQILHAGQWKSAAFLKYLDEERLDESVALQIATVSDDEEWID